MFRTLSLFVTLYAAPLLAAEAAPVTAEAPESAPATEPLQDGSELLEATPPASGERTYPAHAPILAEQPASTRRKRIPLVFLPDLASLAAFTAEDAQATQMVHALEHRQTAGTIVSLGAAAAGGVIMALGMTLPRECTALADDPSRCTASPHWGLLLGGFATTVVGAVVGSWILPGLKDLQAVADVWNAGIPAEERAEWELPAPTP